MREQQEGKRIEVAVGGPLVTNDSDMGVAAALHGLGIANVFEREHVAEHLAEGRLVQLLADWLITRPALFLYHLSRRHFPPALHAFINCMLDRELPTGLRAMQGSGCTRAPSLANALAHAAPELRH